MSLAGDGCVFTINDHYTNNDHSIDNNNFSMLIVSLTLLLALSLTILAPQTHADTSPHNPQTLCDDARIERQQDINRNPDIKPLGQLHKSGEASCFSPAENLYYLGLIEAEAQLGEHAPWYQATDKSSHVKAELACEVMGYTGTPLPATEACVTARYNEIMAPYEEKYEQETIDYIGKRNSLAEKLVVQCVTAFHQHLPQLPQQIQLPLAYYDRKLYSYPDWYVEARIDDNQWLMDMRNTLASEVVRDALKEQCPGDMIWWLYIST